MKILSFLLLFTTLLLANIGQITALKGEASILRGTKTIDLKAGFKLEERDIVSTADKSKVQIVFSDGTVITIGKKSKLDIAEYLYDEQTPKKSKTNFKFLKGAFKSVTGKIGKVAKTRFKMQTKSATIGIRGTVTLGDMKNVACTEGGLEVTPLGADGLPKGPPLEVGAGQMVDASAEQPKVGKISASFMNKMENSTGEKTPIKTEPEEKKSDDKKSDKKKKLDDKKKSDKKKSDEKKSDEKKSDEKKSDGKKSDEKKSDGKKSDEKKSDGKKSDEKKSDGKKSDSKKTNNKPSEKKSDNKPADKKIDEKKSSTNGSDKAPAEEGGEQAPVDEGGEQAPVDEGGEQAPVDEGGEQAPVDEGGEQAPVEEGGDNTPLVQEPTEPTDAPETVDAPEPADAPELVDAPDTIDAPEMLDTPDAVETPLVETPLVETPLVETPLVETPLVETPLVETPLVEMPVIEAPIIELPVIEVDIASITDIVSEVAVVTAEVTTVVSDVVQEQDTTDQADIIVADEPVIDEPVIEEPVIDEPVIDEPVIDEPVIDDTVPTSGGGGGTTTTPSIVTTDLIPSTSTIVPSGATIENPIDSNAYLDYGIWNLASTTGYYVNGVITPSEIIDTLLSGTTTNSYSGTLSATVTNLDKTITATADGSVGFDINFGTKTLTNGTIYVNENVTDGTPAWQADIHSAQITRYGISSSDITGSVVNGTTDVTGNLKGDFYGTGAQAVGGTFDFSSPTSGSVDGAFGATIPAN